MSASETGGNARAPIAESRDLDARIHLDRAPPGGLLPSRSPVQALLVPGAGRAVAAAAAIQGHGFDVRPIRAPTVAAGAERLRVVVHAHNTRDEVAGLAAAIRAALSSS